MTFFQMKKFSSMAVSLVLLIFTAMICPDLAHCQYAYRIVPHATAPASCNPNTGDVYFDTTNKAVYQCIAANTWENIGAVNGSFILSQGTLTASKPMIQHTATWNNAGVTFENFTSNITDTASNAASTVFDFQVGGTTIHSLRKDGLLSNIYGAVFTQGTITGSQPVFSTTATWNNAGATFQNIVSNITDTASNAASTLIDLQVGGTSMFQVDKSGNLEIPQAGGFIWTSRGSWIAGADGVFTASNNAGTGFTRMTLGPGTVAGAGLVPDVVGGQVQGIIIANGDGTTVSFAELAAATNGAMIYCDDCTKATPCAGAGNGALAVRLNGAWDCNP